MAELITDAEIDNLNVWEIWSSVYAKKLLARLRAASVILEAVTGAQDCEALAEATKAAREYLAAVRSEK